MISDDYTSESVFWVPMVIATQNTGRKINMICKCSVVDEGKAVTIED